MTSMQARNLVDGLWQPAQSGRTAPSIDPSTQPDLGKLCSKRTRGCRSGICRGPPPFDRPERTQNARLCQLMMLRWADLMENRGEQLAHFLH